MASNSKIGGKINQKKATIAIVLAVVAVGIVIGVYLWQKGRLQTSADIEQALDQQEEQEFNADNEELALPGNEYRVGNNKVALRSGTLVKLENAPEVYMIYRGTKQHIANIQVFDDLKLKWENVLILPADHSDYLGLYENGPTIDKFDPKHLPNGLTVKFSDDPRVFSILGGKLKHYPVPTVFLTRHNWNEISLFSPENRQMPYDVVPYRYRGGNLVKNPDSPQVYWVAGAKKFHIDSLAEMERWGLRWENVIFAEPGILGSTNPEAHKPMYALGRDTSKITRNFLPMYLWMKTNNSMVYLFLYDNGPKDLQFISGQVFTNRFNWSEISYRHPNRQKATPSPSTSNTASPSASESNYPSGSVKCTVSGHAYNTDWQQIPLTDYARSTYPQGRNKMYEVTRVDGTNNPPRAELQVIFNIKNMTTPDSNQFKAGDQIQVATDIYFVQGANNTTRVENNGQFNLYLTKKDNGDQVAHWLLDDNEFPANILVGTHYKIQTHDPTYTLPANIDYTQVEFSQHYYYNVGNDDCHWPASGEKLTVFSQLSR
ncbi:MAG: hypothetical protein NT039_02445 [Candidatus Berkelbacteria bacterium]|nr:hypothetical protein [Candidatus Berkelbacteria bacterium]